jgi:hypothetical protein
MAISREMTATEANVLNYIKNYATNEMPITAVQLRNEFQCDKRAIENIIESLRVNFGHPIVAKKRKPNGYYLPKNDEERNEGLAP